MTRSSPPSPARQAISDQAACFKAELWRTRSHHEWCRLAGLEHAVQGIAFRDTGGVGFVAFCRASHLEAFDAAEIALVSTFLPHLARALRVQLRLQSVAVAREAWPTLLTTFSKPSFWSTSRARVLHASRSAADLLRALGGLDTDAASPRADWLGQTCELHALVVRAPTTDLGGDIAP